MGMRYWILAALCASLASPAAAQRENRGFRLGQEDRDHREASPTDSPYLVLARTARCTVRKERAKIAELLTTVPASPEEAAWFEGAGDLLDDCVPMPEMMPVGNMRSARGVLRLSTNDTQLRGALAEAMLARVRGRASVADAIPQGEAAVLLAETVLGARSAQPERAFALGFAGCVADANRGLLGQLFETEPGSAAERNAIRAMAPSFGGCVLAGQTLQVDPSALRLSLAEVTYYAFEGRPDA